MPRPEDLPKLESVVDVSKWASNVMANDITPAATGSRGDQVALAGRLGRLTLPSVLQFLALIEKSGKLTITNQESQALILLQRGRIVYAASSSVRETLGNMLVCEKRISEETLLDALERQHKSGIDARLGKILVELGAVEREVIDRLVAQQTEKVIYDVACWSDGFFKFELLQLPQTVTVEAEDFFVDGGLNLNSLLCRVSERIDELRAIESDDDPEASGDGGDSSEEPIENAARTTLPRILREIRSPTFTAEVTLRLQSCASAFLDRAVLFLRRPSWFTGMAQVGVELKSGGSPDDAVRELRIPLTQSSVLAEVLKHRATYHGPVDNTQWNRRLIQTLGGRRPDEAVAVPMQVGDEIVMVLYGDNISSGRPLGSMTELAEVMGHLGMAIEKSVLELRVMDLETRLKMLPPDREP